MAPESLAAARARSEAEAWSEEIDNALRGTGPVAAEPADEAAPDRREQFAQSSAAAYLDHPATHKHLVSGFGAGTLVRTPSGAVTIASLKAGDLVLSREEQGGAVVPRRVLRVQCTANQPLRQLMHACPGRPDARSTLIVTPNHPLWSEGPGWTAVEVLDAEARLGVLEGDPAECAGLTHAYRTDDPDVGWMSSARSRDTSLPGLLWNFTTGRAVAAGVQYDWDRWDPHGDPDGDDAYACYRGVAWDLEVEGTHTYFVGDDGLWTWGASLDGGFRREYAAQLVAFDAAFDAAFAAHLASRKAPKLQEVRYPDGALVQAGDAVVIVQGERPGRVEGPMYAGGTVAWIAVDEGRPGQAMLVPVVDGEVPGLRRAAAKRR